MENSEIQKVLMKALPLEEVHVISDDGSHFQIIAVGKIFSTLNSLKKQQAIYKPLMKYIIDKSIHALSIKTYTPDEWAHNRKLHNF